MDDDHPTEPPEPSPDDDTEPVRDPWLATDTALAGQEPF